MMRGQHAALSFLPALHIVLPIYRIHAQCVDDMILLLIIFAELRLSMCCGCPQCTQFVLWLSAGPHHSSATKGFLTSGGHA